MTTELQQRDTQIQQQAPNMRQKDVQIRQKEEELRQATVELQQKDIELGHIQQSLQVLLHYAHQYPGNATSEFSSMLYTEPTC